MLRPAALESLAGSACEVPAGGGGPSATANRKGIPHTFLHPLKWESLLLTLQMWALL